MSGQCGSRKVPVILVNKRKRPGTSRISPLDYCKGEKRNDEFVKGFSALSCARQARKKKEKKREKGNIRQIPLLEATRTFPIPHEILNPSGFILLLLPLMVLVVYSGRFRPPCLPRMPGVLGLGGEKCVSVGVSKACWPRFWL